MLNVHKNQYQQTFNIEFFDISLDDYTKYICKKFSIWLSIVSIKIKKSAYGNDLFLCIIYLEYMRI